MRVKVYENKDDKKCLSLVPDIQQLRTALPVSKYVSTCLRIDYLIWLYHINYELTHEHIQEKVIKLLRI